MARSINVCCVLCMCDSLYNCKYILHMLHGIHVYGYKYIYTGVELHLSYLWYVCINTDEIYLHQFTSHNTCQFNETPPPPAAHPWAELSFCIAMAIFSHIDYHICTSIYNNVWRNYVQCVRFCYFALLFPIYIFILFVSMKTTKIHRATYPVNRKIFFVHSSGVIQCLYNIIHTLLYK